MSPGYMMRQPSQFQGERRNSAKDQAISPQSTQIQAAGVHAKVELANPSRILQIQAKLGLPIGDRAAILCQLDRRTSVTV